MPVQFCTGGSGTDAMSTSITRCSSIRRESREIVQPHHIGHVKFPLYSGGVGVDQVCSVQNHRGSDEIDWPRHCDKART